MAVQPPTEFDSTDWAKTAVTARGSFGAGAIYADVSGTDPGGSGVGSVWTQVDSGGIGLVSFASGHDREGPGVGMMSFCDLGPGLMADSRKADGIWGVSHGSQSSGVVGTNFSGSGNSIGVYGSADEGTGVVGNSSSPHRAGVYGRRR